jgi:aspartate/methionine/tyrosine aminotransferase
MTSLSTRGQALVDRPPTPEYLREHFARSNAPDYVPLCVAENKLVIDLLLEKVGEHANPPASVLGYGDMHGAKEFRAALAGFLGRRVLGRTPTPEQLVVLAGAGTILESLFYVIADPGDAVLIPTPSYSGFWLDLETRDALSIVPVHTRASDDFRLFPALLDQALSSTRRRVRALLLTSPDNPLGRVYSPDELAAVMDWARRAGVHLVMDEVYALSVYGDRDFTSAASVGALGERVHVVWAFSKDFGASGMRAGVLVSENEALLGAMDQLAYWGSVSGHTQWLLGRAISDDAWVDAFVRTNRQRLREAKSRVTRALDAIGVPYLEPEAGFFLLIDLRRQLETPTFEGEHALYRRLLESTNVNLTPGAACRIAEPGFMRLCFGAVPPEVAVNAIERLGRAL